MAPVKALIWDLDGTLVDSLADIGTAMNQALATCGLPGHPLEAYRAFVGEGVRVLVARAAPAGDREAVLTAYQRAYAAALDVHTVVYPGVRETLDALSARGVPMAVLSNKPDAATREVVTRLLPGVPFVAVQGQVDTLPRKPDPAMALRLAARLGQAPGDIALVGDTAIDLATARAAGMRSVGVTWGFRPGEVMGADLVVSAPAEVLRAWA
jgi:phosphoglycolate phosphatase